MGLSFGLATLEQGLIYSIMVLGVYLSFRVLDYADLSVDGSFPLGAATAAILIFNGANPWLATLIALLAGSIAGMCTGLLHTKLGISPLLSGILTMTGLYSLNLRIMGGANVPLLRKHTIFDDLISWGVPGQYAVLLLTGLTVVILVLGLRWFLETEFGLGVRATGINERMATSQGINVNITKVCGLSVSNMLVAWCGAYAAQYQHFADISMGIGMIIMGLASVMIGEVLFGRETVPRALVAVVGGSLVYRAVIALVLRMGLTPTDLKLATALLVIVALTSPAIKARFRSESVKS